MEKREKRSQKSVSIEQCVCEEIVKLKVAKIELCRLKALPLNNLKPERGQMNQMNTTVINTQYLANNPRAQTSTALRLTSSKFNQSS